MAFGRDILYKKIMDLVNSAEEPLETREVEQMLQKFSRTKILYRLNNLRGDSKINGKQVGSGKGAWIWWNIQSLSKRKS